jgi:hypothetical protein
MASIVNYVADGATNQFQIPFTYINQSDVVVTVNGTAPTFTFLNSTTINITATPASGAKVIISRATPLNPLVDFADGSTLFEADLDLAHQQNRLIAEESRDRADSAIATINANIDNIDTVAEIAGNINIVAGNTTNVNSVAANMAEVLTADDNAATATTKANEASASASTASAQATISTTKAGESSTSAAEALASKNAASASESASSTSETNAANSATSSSNSASASASSASSANSSQIVATTKAAEAVVSANNSAVSATNSANSATTAITKANEASASQIAASNSETNALSSKNAAASSATNAATSETNSASSATASANSAATATTKANEAATSATSSANSATASANSATAAAASAASITGAETNAANSATAAASSATAASASKDAALAALDSFDDRYLGVKSSNPSVDNDGNALVAGSLYFNSTDDTMKVYEGSTWVAAYASLSGAVLQTGSTMSGDLSFGDNDKAIFGAGSDLQIYHDGGNSFVDEVGDGRLYIRASDGIFMSTPSNALYLSTYDTGGVSLYHNGVKKFDTTATGIDVTGTVNADGLTVEGSSVTATIHASTTNSGLALTNGSTNTQIRDWDIRSNNAALGDFVIRRENSYGSGVNTKVVSMSSGGDISFYEDTGTTAKFFWDASAESLTVEGFIETPYISLGNTGNSYQTVTGSSDGNDLTYRAYQNHIFKNTTGASSSTDGTEAMRIDSSGNVLVGTTTSFVGGVTISPLGVVQAERNNVSGVFNRTSTDGEIVQFRKDGSAVGSIGTVSSGLLVGSTDSALYFHTDNNIYPYNPSSSSYRNGDVDLGWSSGRFKDLHLSGGVSLDGSSGNTLYKSGSDLVLNNRANATTIFGTNNTERMRIESSGNLFVGKTSSGGNSTGFEVRPTGDTLITRTGGRSLFVNRMSDDGESIVIAKDGTSVGAIGSSSGNITVNSSSTGLLQTAGVNRYSWDTDQFYPAVDGSKNLGTSSLRFQHGYFSGNLYGDGSNLTGVGGSTAYGAVGTYILASTLMGSNTIRSGGYTESGSSLRYHDEYSGSPSYGSRVHPIQDHQTPTGYAANPSLSGTWRLMLPRLQQFMGGYYPGLKYFTALWVRIS